MIIISYPDKRYFYSLKSFFVSIGKDEDVCELLFLLHRGCNVAEVIILNNVFQHGTTARGNHEAYLVRERRDYEGIASHVFCTVELYPVGGSLVQNIVKIYAAVLVGRSLTTFGIVYFPIAIYQYRRGQRIFLVLPLFSLVG